MAIFDDKISHVVVLMLENRSFDSMLGRLYGPTPDFDGLTLAETNLDLDGTPIGVWNQPGGVDRSMMKIPDPDPGESFTDMNAQIFGLESPPPGTPATMRGFAQNYQNQANRHLVGHYDPRAVMHYFNPEQLPVLSKLARQFAVSDRWHASAPCQTWPNRFFAHTGTAGGFENNEPGHVPFEMPTIFTRFSTPNAWKIYFHDVAQAWALGDLWPHRTQIQHYQNFKADVKARNLPQYSFIEPKYFTDFVLPNDCHPPHVVSLAEELVADVYETLRTSDLWAQSLLVVTFDEHGGCYDHVPPPAAVPPDDLWQSNGRPFAFDRYGVRVPAVLVSPYIEQGRVLRPPKDGPPFDHTSIIRTLRRRFNLGPALTRRDAAAPDLYDVLTLSDPLNMGPESVEPSSHGFAREELVAAQQAQPNGIQDALHKMTFRLPGVGLPPPGVGAEAKTVADAAAEVQRNLSKFR
jgi:phospholipase C